MKMEEISSSKPKAVVSKNIKANEKFHKKHPALTAFVTPKKKRAPIKSMGAALEHGHTNLYFINDDEPDALQLKQQAAIWQLSNTSPDSTQVTYGDSSIPQQQQEPFVAWATHTREEVISLQSKLNKRAIAKSLSIMYGLLIVSISFTFVVAMLWIDDYTRLTTDVVSTALMLPGVAFILFCFCSMYEKNSKNNLSAHAGEATDSSRWRNAWRIPGGGKNLPRTAPISTSCAPGVLQPDALNGFLKTALLVLTFGAVAQHVMLLVEHHTGPYYTDYPEIYLVKLRKHAVPGKVTAHNNATIHTRFRLSTISQQLFLETMFWHAYVALSIATYLLSTLFLLNLPKFRFERHRLLSCVGMIHLCVLNGYLWLYLTALETKIDLDLDTFGGLNIHENNLTKNQNHSGLHNATLSPNEPLSQLLTNNEHTSNSNIQYDKKNAALVFPQPQPRIGRVFHFQLNNFDSPESSDNSSVSSSEEYGANNNSTEEDSSSSSSDDSSDSPDRRDWRERLLRQTGHQSVPKALAEFFFPFIPEMVIINITTLLVNWLLITRNTATVTQRQRIRQPQLSLKTRHELVEVRELDKQTDSETLWRSLKSQTFGSWMMIASSVLILLATSTLIIALRYVFKVDKKTELQRILPVIVESVLYLCMIASSLYAWYYLNKLTRIRKHVIKEYLDRALLATCVVGMYSFATWSMIGVLHTPTLEGILNAVSAVLLVIEATVQTLLIMDAGNRVHVCWQSDDHKPALFTTSLSSNTSDNNSDSRQLPPEMIRAVRQTPGRASLAFLLLVNNAFWIINVFRTLQAREHPLEMAYYGALGWTIIVHLTVPAMILFRFHAAVMLFEIWLSLSRVVVPVRKGGPARTVNISDSKPELQLHAKSLFSPHLVGLNEVQNSRACVQYWKTHVSTPARGTRCSAGRTLSLGECQLCSSNYVNQDKPAGRPLSHMSGWTLISSDNDNVQMHANMHTDRC